MDYRYGLQKNSLECTLLSYVRHIYDFGTL